jgi:hypothetical protein
MDVSVARRTGSARGDRIGYIAYWAVTEKFMKFRLFAFGAPNMAPKLLANLPFWKARFRGREIGLRAMVASAPRRDEDAHPFRSHLL